MPATHTIVGVILILMGGSEILRVIAHVTGVQHDASFKPGLEILYIFVGASVIWLGATLQRGWKGLATRLMLLIALDVAFSYGWLILLNSWRA